MKAIILILALGLVASSADASVRRTVRCEVEHDGKTQSLYLKMEGVRIIPWSKKKWASKIKPRDGVFFWFGQDREDSEIEREKTSVKNGYSTLELGTTEESVKIGVSLPRQAGIYQYKDRGSGNGNLKLSLSCWAEGRQ